MLLNLSCILAAVGAMEEARQSSTWIRSACVPPHLDQCWFPPRKF